MAATAKAGCLLVLNSSGHLVETFAGGPINGPWDMTALDAGNLVALFVTNVLNGTVAANGSVVHHGTVLRLILSASVEQKPQLLLSTIVGSGFPTRTDPAALVIGPTGLALDIDKDKLFVADSLRNRVAVIVNPLSRRASAGTGLTLSENGSLNDPLGMALAPNGDVLTANGNDGNIVEITEAGVQVAKKLVDNTGTPPGAGTLFGLIAQPGKVYFVDDGSNTLRLLE
jgi:DNA-binding beta-propeller fold protein YncE